MLVHAIATNAAHDFATDVRLGLTRRAAERAAIKVSL